MDKNDLPLGFSFALAQNPDAMMRFANMTEQEQAETLQKAREVSSKKEMQTIVNHLASQMME